MSDFQGIFHFEICTLQMKWAQTIWRSPQLPYSMFLLFFGKSNATYFNCLCQCHFNLAHAPEQGTSHFKCKIR